MLEEVVADLECSPDRNRKHGVRENRHLKGEAEDVGKEHGQMPARFQARESEERVEVTEVYLVLRPAHDDRRETSGLRQACGGVQGPRHIANGGRAAAQLYPQCLRHTTSRRVQLLQSATPGTNCEHRARRQSHDALGDAPHQHALDPRAPVSAHHDEVGALPLRDANDGRRRRAFD